MLAYVTASRCTSILDFSFIRLLSAATRSLAYAARPRTFRAHLEVPDRCSIVAMDHSLKATSMKLDGR